MNTKAKNPVTAFRAAVLIVLVLGCAPLCRADVSLKTRREFKNELHQLTDTQLAQAWAFLSAVDQAFCGQKGDDGQKLPGRCAKFSAEVRDVSAELQKRHLQDLMRVQTGGAEINFTTGDGAYTAQASDGEAAIDGPMEDVHSNNATR